MGLTRITSDGITDGSIVNADINSSAAIDGTKISPSFTSDITITNTGPSLALVDTNHNSDYRVKAQSGIFMVEDTTNSNVARLAIDSSGLVGIGTTSPARKLHLHESSSNNNFISFTNSTTGSTSGDGILVGMDSDESLLITNKENNHIAFATNNTERMRLDSSGNVSIGSTSNVAPLNVRAMTDGNLHIRPITSIHSGTGVGLDVLNNANSAVKDLAIRAATTVFRNASGESMRIDSSGTVAINTTSPSSGIELEVNGKAKVNSIGIGTVPIDHQHIHIESDNPRVLIRSTGTNPAKLMFGDQSNNDAGVIEYAHSNNSMMLSTGTVERMRLDSSGNVGIGKVPSRTLDVAGKIRSSDSVCFGDNSSTPSEGAAIHRPAASTLGFVTNDSERMRIDSSGNVGIGIQSPTGNFHIQSASAITDDLDMLVIDGGSTGFNQGNDASTDYGIQFKGCSFATGGFGIQQRIGAQILFHKDGTWNASNGGGGQCRTDIIFTTSSGTFNSSPSTLAQTERMRIKSDGRIFIGHSNPAAAANADDLCIGNNDGSGETGITLGSNTASGIRFADGGSNSAAVIQYTHGSTNAFQFSAEGAERMRIDSSARVGIGTSTTNNPDIADGGLQIRPNQTNGAPDVHFTRASSSNTSHVVGFVNGNVGVGSISYTNGGTSYNSFSDYRLKENVVAISDGIARLKTLKPSRFNLIDDETNTFYDGFIAHEVSSIVPEAITGEKDEVDSNNKPVYQGIDQSKLVPLLVAAVQELTAKVEALEAK